MPDSIKIQAAKIAMSLLLIGEVSEMPGANPSIEGEVFPECRSPRQGARIPHEVTQNQDTQIIDIPVVGPVHTADNGQQVTTVTPITSPSRLRASLPELYKTIIYVQGTELNAKEFTEEMHKLYYDYKRYEVAYNEAAATLWCIQNTSQVSVKLYQLGATSISISASAPIINMNRGNESAPMRHYFSKLYRYISDGYKIYNLCHLHDIIKSMINELRVLGADLCEPVHEQALYTPENIKACEDPTAYPGSPTMTTPLDQLWSMLIKSLVRVNLRFNKLHQSIINAVLYVQSKNNIVTVKTNSSLFTFR